MNIVSLTGRITKDIELKTTNNGVSVTQFTVAVKRPHVKETTDFFRIVCWRSQAEFVSKYFSKGDGIEITGVLTQRKYEDKEGNSREVIEVQADTVSFPVSTKNEDTKPQSNGNEFAKVDSSEFTEVDNDDDLPF